MENQVSIIINGVRYDAVDTGCETACKDCDLEEWCDRVDFYMACAPMYRERIGVIFKKSDKKFEV